MPCKLCLNSAVTRKAPQTPTCRNYCNLHLHLAQTSHTTAGRPQRGEAVCIVSHHATILRLWQHLSSPGCSRDMCEFRRALLFHECACMHQLSISSVCIIVIYSLFFLKKKVCSLPRRWKYLTKRPCLCVFPPTLIFFPLSHSTNKQMLFALQTQAHLLLGEAKYVGGKQGRNTGIKQVYRW